MQNGYIANALLVTEVQKTETGRIMSVTDIECTRLIHVDDAGNEKVLMMFRGSSQDDED